MKSSTKVLSAIALTVAITGASQANEIVSKDNTMATQLCVVAAQGNKAVLHNTIKASGLSTNHIVKNIQCNEQPISQFVAKHGKNATEINAMLDRYQSHGQVEITDLASL